MPRPAHPPELDRGALLAVPPGDLGLPAREMAVCVVPFIKARIIIHRLGRIAVIVARVGEGGLGGAAVDGAVVAHDGGAEVLFVVMVMGIGFGFQSGCVQQQSVLVLTSLTMLSSDVQTSSMEMGWEGVHGSGISPGATVATAVTSSECSQARMLVMAWYGCVFRGLIGSVDESMEFG